MKQVKVDDKLYNVYGTQYADNGYIQVNIGKTGPERCINVQHNWWYDAKCKARCYTSGEWIEKIY